MTASEHRFNDSTTSDDWLGPIIRKAKRKHRCSKMGCTTCGARGFRTSIEQAVLQRHGDPNAVFASFECQRVLIDGLRTMQPLDDPDHEDKHKYEQAVQFIITEMVWMSGFDSALDTELSGTWAGSVLQGIRDHAQWRRDHRATVAANEQRRASDAVKRRQLRQEAHAQRLIEQAERSKRWHEQNDQGTGGEGESGN
jgi:hypothetical protein